MWVRRVLSKPIPPKKIMKKQRKRKPISKSLISKCPLTPGIHSDSLSTCFFHSEKEKQSSIPFQINLGFVVVVVV
jgi:hypothetical protein